MVMPYVKGRNFEHSVKRLFQRFGYYVWRSYASRGPADLVAVKDGKALLIQCKVGKWHSVEDWNKFFELCQRLKVRAIYCTKESQIAVYEITGKKDGTGKKLPIKPFRP